MLNKTQAQYLETEILSADPLKLVSLLYRGAIEAIGSARAQLAAPASPATIAERSRQITRAWEIVQELGRSLDRERGGEISARLGDLYGYIQNRLLEGNSKQADAPLAEAESLMRTLADAWREIAQQAARATPVVAGAMMESYRSVSCSA
jgi:flagellar secretion chaperone FliS